jgi:hypothetical protein
MYQLCTKLKRADVELRKLCKERFSDLPSRVALAREKLEGIQKQIQQSPLDTNLHYEEARAAKEYSDISRAEESFLRQKSRVQWRG